VGAPACDDQCSEPQPALAGIIGARLGPTAAMSRRRLARHPPGGQCASVWAIEAPHSVARSRLARRAGRYIAAPQAMRCSA
jgi:hypothetical protein